MKVLAMKMFLLVTMRFMSCSLVISKIAESSDLAD